MAQAPFRVLIGIGDSLMAVCENVSDFVMLALATLRAMFSRPFYLSIAIEQFNLLIIKSMPLVLLAALSTGAVMALQFGAGMTRFGGKLFVPTLVATAVVRALGPIFTSLMVAGRVGAGVAAEIGSMAVTQQVDAIRALGTDPIRKLVVPRIVVLIIGVPMLTLLADLVGIGGGLLVSSGSLGISPSLYIQKSYDAIKLMDLLVGTGKTAIYGAIVGLIGCYNGLHTRDGTVGIGVATTKTVVGASIFILLGDVLVTKLSWILQ